MMNNKGATSILIIMLMVVLMVFGLTILTATLSNDALSNKKIEWLEDYYALESKAAEALRNLDYEVNELIIEVSQLPVEERDGYFIDKIMEKYETDVFLYHTFRVSEEQGDYLKHIDIVVRFKEPSELTDEDKMYFDVVAYTQNQDLFEYNDIEFGVPYPPKEE